MKDNWLIFRLRGIQGSVRAMTHDCPELELTSKIVQSDIDAIITNIKSKYPLKDATNQEEVK